MKPWPYKYLLFLLTLAVFNAGYLTWRFILTDANPDLIGSSICSFTDTIDCDKVLNTAQARAFYTPNAILGFGFLLACLIWVFLGFRLERKFWRPLMLILRAMLFLASGFTLVFWYLLLNLEVFCVLCPLNHLSIYLALFFCQKVIDKLPNETRIDEYPPLIKLASLCMGLFFLIQIIWIWVLNPGDWLWANVWIF